MTKTNNMTENELRDLIRSEVGIAMRSAEFLQPLREHVQDELDKRAQRIVERRWKGAAIAMVVGIIFLMGIAFQKAWGDEFQGSTAHSDGSETRYWKDDNGFYYQDRICRGGPCALPGSEFRGGN